MNTLETFMVALRLEGRRAVVLGGDREAFDKARGLHAAGAALTVISDVCLPEFEDWIAAHNLPRFARDFTDDDLAGAFVVFSASRDEAVSQRVFALAEAHRFLVCCVDQVAYCTWANLATSRVGAVSFALGSNGATPALLKRLRQSLIDGLQGEFAEFSLALAALRRELPASVRRDAMERCLKGIELRMRVTLPSQWRARFELERARAARP